MIRSENTICSAESKIQNNIMFIFENKGKRHIQV